MALKTIAKLAAVAVLLLAAMEVACWRTVSVSRSPDKQHEIRIQEWCIGPDCGIRVQAGPVFWPATIGQIGDAVLVFAYSAWSADSKRVGVIVVSGYGGSIKAAYDTDARRRLPFDVVAPLVREAIRSRFGPSASDLAEYKGDPILWAERSQLARDRFSYLTRRP